MQSLSDFAVLDSANDDPLSSMVRLLRQQLGLKSALISVGKGSQLISRALDGAPVSTALLLNSLTSSLNTTDSILTVTDAQSDARINRAALAESPSLRFIAACPLRAVEGELLGVLCLLHDEPCVLDAAQHASLLVVARFAAQFLEQEAQIARQAQELEALRDSERRMALAISGSGTGVWDRNVLSGEIYYSSGWKALLGYADHEIGNRIEESYTRVHPDDLAYVKATIADHLQHRTGEYEVEHRIRCKDGSYKWVCSRGKVVERNAAGESLRMVGTTTDITSKRELSDQSRKTANLLTDLTDEIPGMAFQFQRSADGDLRFTYVSAGSYELFGVTPEQLLSDPHALRSTIHPQDLAGYLHSFDSTTRDLTPWHYEYRVLITGRGVGWRQGDARPKQMPDGSVLWHGFIADISPHKSIEAELQVFATTDSLTQLSNRRWFLVQLEAELNNVQRKAEHSAALLMLDLDHFKKINDQWGHTVGDQVLRHFAKLLRAQLRISDTAGRLGGEEFAVVLSNADTPKAAKFAERLQEELKSAPLIHDGQPIHMTVSVGIAAITPSDDKVEVSLSRSDIALYRAKRNGRDRIECYD